MSEDPFCEGSGLAPDGEHECDACEGSGKWVDAVATVAREAAEWLRESGYGQTAVCRDLDTLFPKRAR